MKIINRYFIKSDFSSHIQTEVLKVVDDMNEQFGIIIHVDEYKTNDKDIQHHVSVVNLRGLSATHIDIPAKYLNVYVGETIQADTFTDDSVHVVRWDENIINDKDVYVASLSYDDLNF